MTMSAKAGYSATREEIHWASKLILVRANNATHGFKVVDQNLMEIVEAGSSYVPANENPHNL